MASDNRGSITAKVTVATAILFIALLGLLHILEPEFKPSWRLISEYELGQYGWLMRAAFFALALSGFSLILALWKNVKRVSGYIGLVFLLIASIGLAMAGYFVTDAVNVPREAWTSHGAMHAWGAVMMIPTAPLLATLLTFALSRSGVIAASRKRWLWMATAAIWASFLAFSISGGTRTDGAQSASDWYGWPNRTFILSYATWLALAGWIMLRKAKNR